MAKIYVVTSFVRTVDTHIVKRLFPNMFTNVVVYEPAPVPPYDVMVAEKLASHVKPMAEKIVGHFDGLVAELKLDTKTIVDTLMSSRPAKTIVSGLAMALKRMPVTVIVDRPEKELTPMMQAIFARALLRLVRSIEPINATIVILTHSAHVVVGLAREAEIINIVDESKALGQYPFAALALADYVIAHF